ncbi:hypothetical protein ACMDCR_18015 [Labrys okinawensis]|uniref:hypothetical protein n=1 Tax=Labrys okinawensis TaxID=346911 RepID=UPI0039BC6F27
MFRSNRIKEFSEAGVRHAEGVQAQVPASGEIGLLIDAIGLHHPESTASADCPTIPHATA